MSEIADQLARHEQANYTDGLRDLAGLGHVTDMMGAVLRDAADLIDALEMKRIQARNAALEDAARVVDDASTGPFGQNARGRLLATAIRGLATTTTKGDD